MNSRHLLLIAACIAAIGIPAVTAQDSLPPEIVLPQPRVRSGMPLLEALSKRQSGREFSPDALSSTVLSDLLWAACGVNRPGSGMRTAPTAVNWQEIDVYLVNSNGIYRFDARAHRLLPLLGGDHRATVGIQEYPATAPVILVYVADFSRMTRASDQDKVFYSATDTGFISQNVYLYCASEGLATCVIGLVKRRPLGELLQLSEHQRIILAQPVGYPPSARAEP